MSRAPGSRTLLGMILIGYDGSTDSQAAIDRAAELFPGHPVLVLTVWEPFLDMMARSGAGLGLAPGIVDFETIDRASERSARECAQEGVKRAHSAGLRAEPHIRVRHTTVAAAILEEAAATGAEAVLLGTRGLAGLRSLMMGSVSHAVLHDADLPVVVVPSAETAEHRRAHRDRDAAAR
jgi:nucleotide-binding universal stress UspA family protein